jgi:hypothetical protein
MTGRLPADNPTTSFWLSTPHRLAQHRSSESVPEECDIAIIGTGLAGVASAYHILTSTDSGPKRKVVLFEARQACSGATGRNGMLLFGPARPAQLLTGKLQADM